MRRGIAILLVVCGLLSLAACRGEPTAPEETSSVTGAGQLRLLLFIVIDQGGTHDLLRFRDLYRGGLARLLDEGALFTDAHHDHAETVTAAGHAALATGLYPGHSGIISNEWFDRATRTEIYCVQDAQYHRSPANLKGTTLSDWLKSQDRLSKGFSVSGKDRAAILMGGHTADAAYWYDRLTGAFTSTDYYPAGNPSWLAEFNRRGIVDTYFGTMWEPLPLDGVDPGAFDIVDVNPGPFGSRFPHAIGRLALTPDSAFYRSFFVTPFQDDYLVEFARTLIEQENLGGDEHLDVLSVGFSALDAVGHTWGPNSREFLDTLLRLDRSLGDLLSFLDERVGVERLMVALSADHGVLPLPEYLAQTGLPGRRLGDADTSCFQQAGRQLRERLGDGEWILEFPYLNYSLIAARNLTRQEVEEELVRLLETCDAVERVWTRTQMEAREPPDDPFFRLFSHAFHPERSGDVFVQFKEAHLPRMRRGTSHGSLYPYDTHVPLLIAGPGIKPGPVARRVHTVDLAPTLAPLLGVRAPGNLDGVDRSALIRSPSR